MRQSIWKQLQVPYAPANDITESPPTFLEELNRQSDKILFFSSLIALIAWLPHIRIDLQLHPEYPIIVAFRFGLSLIGLTILILQCFPRFNRHKLLLLIFMVAYVEIAMGIITGLTKADLAYLGGYYLVISFLALGPYPRKVAWAILALSLISFFTVGFSVGMQFDSLRARYGLIDLFVVAIMASLLVYILDRMRFNSWQKSRKIEQQNEILKSDKSRIKKLLQEIRLSEKKFRQLFDHSPVGIFLTTFEGKILEANKTMLSILKFKSMEAINAEGLPNLYVHKEDRSALWERALSGPVYGFETVFRRADGTLIYVAIGAYLVYDEEQKVSFMEGTVEDVTARKQIENALRESKERLLTIIEGTKAALVTVDAEGRFTYTNDAMAKMLGLSKAEEIIGKIYLHYIHPDDRQRIRDEFIRQVNNRQPASIQVFRIIDIEGRVKWLSFLSTLMIRDGEFIGQTGVAQDVTDRKQAEEALARSEQEVRDSYIKLKKLEELKDNLTNMVVHDMRSPLTTIAGSLELINHNLDLKKLDPTVRKYLRMADNSSHDLANMVQSLLDITRFESNEMPFNKEWVDLKALTEEAIATMETQVEHAGQYIRLTGEKTEGRVDPVIFKRVMVNLINNAIKASNKGDTTEVYTSSTNGSLLIEVRDNGRGIPEKYHQRIFDRFASADADDRRSASSIGLGLTFCKLAIEAHQGKIEVESKVGSGSVFRIRIPKQA